MAKQSQRSLTLAALDIGSTKVTFAIGVLNDNTKALEVVGLGTAPHLGVKQGVVVNIDATSEAIQKAREEAELMAGVQCTNVWLGVGGTHVQSFDSGGMIAIRNKEVDSEDIARVIEAAKAVAIPNDREVLHVLPKSFKIDGQEGILDPIGMSGVRLEASVHIVTASLSAVQNLEKCITKSGLTIEGKVLQQYATALAVLSDDEKNLGVCVVDLGGGTVDLITYLHGSVMHTAVIPVGGSNFTHDVAMGLKTTQVHAEALKKKFGHALSDLVDSSEVIEVESVGGRNPRTLARRDLCDVLEARAEETLTLVRRELEGRGLMASLGSGIVLTGGASQLEGLVEMGDYVFDVPVRRGIPQRVGGLTDVVRSASCACAVGILQYAKLNTNERRNDKSQDDLGMFFSTFTQKIRDLFS